MRNLIEVVSDTTESKIGVKGGKPYAFNYLYILPMSGVYDLPGTGYSTSFASFAHDQNRIITGAWEDVELETKVTAWALDTSLLGKNLLSSSTPAATYTFTPLHVQGALLYEDHFFLSSSHNRADERGHLWQWYMPGGSDCFTNSPTIPLGPEDLEHDPATDFLWQLTEFSPDDDIDGAARYVYATRMSDLLSTDCD